MNISKLDTKTFIITIKWNTNYIAVCIFIWMHLQTYWHYLQWFCGFMNDKCKQRGFFKRIIAFLLYGILSNSGLYPIELIFLLCSYCVLRFYVVLWDSFIVWLLYSTFSRFSSAKHVSALLYVPWTGTYSEYEYSEQNISNFQDLPFFKGFFRLSDLPFF